MFKLLNLVRKPQVLNARQFELFKRTFLSQAYQCNDAWKQRLNDPILRKVNLDDLYQSLEQRYQKMGLISAVDVDIFVNAAEEDIYVDELLDLVHKLRMSAETTNALPSTQHAVVRYLLDHNRKIDLLNALDDRLNYGIFLDYYSANILLNEFYKTNDFVSGVRVASQLMLQDEFEHSISSNLSLLHCCKFLQNPTGWPEPEKIEEPEEVVKVRVKFLRNPYDDQHFDLRDPLQITAKILFTVTKNSTNNLDKSLHILGLALFGKHDKVAELATKQNIKIYKEVANLLPEENESKQKINELATESADIFAILADRIKQSEVQLAENDITAQCKQYTQWQTIRSDALEHQRKRLETADRIAKIEETQQMLKTKEEKLWFFEREEDIELQIEENQKQDKVVTRKVTKTDDTYVPPEI